MSEAGLNKSLYDAYIKAFRWSTDRLDPKNGGIICFVSNGAWLDGNSTDGFRKSLEKEFDSIYVFNLRGNARTSGELRRKEAGNVFKEGSRTPISITLLVKNPESKKENAEIFYKDIGDYLTREEKLKIISEDKTFLNKDLELSTLQPNEHGDWINHRNSAFDDFIPLAPEKKFDIQTYSFFLINAVGIATNRDNFVYNFNKIELFDNIQKMVNFYNNHLIQYKKTLSNNPNLRLDNFISNDLTKIKWTVNLLKDFSNLKQIDTNNENIVLGYYRPFSKYFLYFDKSLIERPGNTNKLFPNKNTKNLLITISGMGSSKEFSLIISDSIIDIQAVMNGQSFPLYYYEEPKTTQKGLFDDPNETDYVRRDAVSDFILERAKKQYGKNVTKEDIFYYVYGFLHSPDYRETFASDLKKMLPKLPLVEDVKDFWAFSKAGRQLADLHLNYETVPAYTEVNVVGADSNNFLVDKMRFPKKGQKDTIIYNSHIVISNIPEKAYEYVVNGKSAIEWIMERYQITIHKDSGITNNPNDWATEVGNPRYILDLLLSIINVSVQTVVIVESLPKLKFE